MDLNLIREEFLQWQKDTGRSEYILTDIFVNDNNEMKTEKKMAWVVKTSPEDWIEFCKDTGRECKGTINLLAIY